jgi:hypothetical protein
VEQSGEQRLAALLAEQAQTIATLAEHREQRERLLREGGSLGPVTAMATEDQTLKLRLEQIAYQIDDAQAVVDGERLAAWEAAWQARRPALATVEGELAEAIIALYAVLTRAHAVHNAAAGFGDRVREFVAPPPLAPLSDYAMRQFVTTVEQRRQQADAQSVRAVEIFVDADVPLAQRFRPRRVSVDEIEAISPIAPPRKVRIVHGPVRAANLNIGIARMFPGEQHTVSARAAHALTASGCATYADNEATTAA